MLHRLQRYDWGKNFKKTGHMTLITPLLGVVCHRTVRFDTVYLRANVTILAPAIPEISLKPSKFKVGRVSLTTPF